MIDYYVKLVGADHVGIASDDMFTTKPVMDFVAKNASMYTDDGYMVNAFDKGATGCGELAKILPAITDELWEGFAPEDDPVSRAERDRFIDEQRNKFYQR